MWKSLRKRLWPSSKWTDMNNTGIYIHIPFCRSKCGYCDFPSYAGQETLYDAYTAALCRELAGRGGLFSRVRIDSIYIGGGTPSLLPEKNLAAIIETMRKHFVLAPDAEFSLEANPGTVDKGKLSFLREEGINRLSFGVQSFNDHLLRRLGRIHSRQEAVQAVHWAQQVGFDNINVDLMSGLPEQTLGDWTADLTQAVALGVQHISAYGLAIEVGTPFFAAREAGCLPLPDEELEEAMYDRTEDYLAGHGFFRYEISNYAAANRQCRHNLKYWRYLPYLGFGAAAHSFIDGKRLANTPDVREYIAALAEERLPVLTEERPGLDDAMAEFVFLALRTVNGVSLAEFKERFGIDFRQQFAAPIAGLCQAGLLEIGADSAFLTRRGMKFGNEAFQAFLPDKT